MIASMLLGLLVATLQAAEPVPVASAPAPTPPVADKPICRREVPTGSNFPRKICHSKAEWAMIDGVN